MPTPKTDKRAQVKNRGERQLLTSFWLPMFASLVDIGAVITAALLSYALRFYSYLNYWLPAHWQPKVTNYALFGLVLGLIYVVVSWSYRSYGTRIRIPLEQEVGRILRGSLLSMGAILAIIFFYREFEYSRAVFLLTLFLMIPCLIAARTIFQRLQGFLFKRGIGVQRIGMWGSGDVAAKLWQDFLRGRSQGFELVGAIGKAPVAGGASLGDVTHLKSLVFEHGLDIIVMAPPPGEEERMYDLLRESEGITVELLYCPAAVEITQSRIRVTEVGGRPVLRFKSIPMSGWRYIAKRLIDFGASALFLLTFCWLYALLALIVFFDSGRPIFYRQNRVGMDGREFDIIKFRTMRTDAEAKSGPVWAVKGDSRVTKVGGFYRRWSLDELPQIWSVFRGYMSLVGPRPERPHFVEEFSRRIPQYLDRHRVKSGLTGWAQVNGARGSDSTIEQRTEYDLYYIENWSLWLDLRILFRTIMAVIKGDGAM